MSGLVEAACHHFEKSCFAKKCCKRGCCVSLQDAPEVRLIIDFDKKGSPLGNSKKRPDYLFVADTSDGSGWVAPIELTSGTKTARKAVRQLRAGIKIMEKKKLFAGKKFAFRPVFAAREMRRAELNALREPRYRIKFGSRSPEIVRFIRCGDSLSSVFSS